MFGGYAEVAAYYTDTHLALQYGMAGDRGPLPAEYIPQSNTRDPWHTDAVCQKDFVLVAEFSEQEGPKPLITIPRNISSSLDLNDFSVQILSVDYQTSSGPKFDLCEDKQVLATDSKNGISSFVHHFTLYDSQARGFVRPFCMTYVTPDSSKLMSFYDELCAEFAQVSHCFKYGNRHLFVRDMTHYLSDLHYTKERYMEREERSREDDGEMDEERAQEEKILSTVNLPTLDNIITEVKHILETTSALPEDDELEMRFSVLEESASSHHGNTSQQTPLNFETFHYSCSLHSNDTKLSHLDHKLLRRSESSCEMEETWSPHPSESYKPKVVRTTKKRFEKSLRSLHELCRWGAKEGLNRLRSLHTYFSRERAILHIERKDAAAIEPSSGLLTIGRNVQLNLLCADDMFDAHTPLHGHHCSLVSSPSCLLPHRSHSDETLGSFHSAESFLSCVEDASSLTSDPISIPANSSSDSKDIEGECVCTEDESQNTSSEPLNVPQQTNSTIGGSSSGSSLSSSQGHDSPDGVARYTVVRPGRLEFHSVPVMSVVSSADHVNNLNSNSPGYGLLRLAQQFSFTPALFYALLCGRPLIVLGSSKQERDVRSAVTALSLFVTGHTGEDVVGWRTRPVRLADITHIKLMGLGRTSKKSADSMVPSSVQRYVSILNLEKKTLWTPPYEGGVLTDVYSKRKVFKKDQPYIYFIHSVLYELSQKALLYYHAFSTSEVAATNGFTGAVSIQERQLYLNISASFCSKLRLSNADVSIVKHLVAMVQKQQVSDLQQHDGTDLSQSSVMLDYRQCSLYKVT